MKVVVLLALIILAISAPVPNWRPVVLMHGLLAGSEAMSHAQGWIEADFPVSYLHMQSWNIY